tara:strand:+ start:351 stop:716 length:366 start_codon:yes stop_codon:yes gene_type:complete
MAPNKKSKKDKEEEETLIGRLLKEELEEDETKIPTAIQGDVIAPPQQPMMQQSSGGSGGNKGLQTAMTIAKIGAMAAGVPLPFEEGGQIKKKTKKKKKRVVRGVGAAKRGYGKATYSNKMY